MNLSPFRLDGKIILVTGASSGIGKATAIECSRQGARLIIHGRDSQRLKETLLELEGKGHTMICSDLTLSESIDNLVSEIEFLDGLVICSGKGLSALLQFATKDKFMDMLEVNFLAPIELLRMVVKKKKLKHNSSVIAIASMAGTHFHTIGNGVYGASKAALDSYLKFVARELAPKGIRVNTILPAMIETPFIHNGVAGKEDLVRDALSYPLKRYGKPEEVAFATIYLLSDAAAWITGTSLIMDGGKSLV